jgi:hypothetical protein
MATTPLDGVRCGHTVDAPTARVKRCSRENSSARLPASAFTVAAMPAAARAAVLGEIDGLVREVTAGKA